MPKKGKYNAIKRDNTMPKKGEYNAKKKENEMQQYGIKQSPQKRANTPLTKLYKVFLTFTFNPGQNILQMEKVFFQ